MLIAAAIFIRRLKQSTGLDNYLRNPYLPTKKVPRTNVDCLRNLYSQPKLVSQTSLAT